MVTNGSTTLTLGTPADVKTAEYEYRWSASENVPTIYSNVPVINFTGYTKLSECTVTYKNLGSPDCYIEIYMKKELTSINIFSAITASFKVTATASTTTGTGSFSKSGRLNVSVDTTIKVYEDDTITVS